MAVTDKQQRTAQTTADHRRAGGRVSTKVTSCLMGGHRYPSVDANGDTVETIRVSLVASSLLCSIVRRTCLLPAQK